MGAAIALLVLLSTLGAAACVGDGFTTGSSALGTGSGAAGPTRSASTTGGAGGSLSTTASAAGGGGGTLSTTASAAGGGGAPTISSSTAGSTETASSTVSCGCPVDAPTAGYPCCVPEGNACLYGQCADAGREEATCKQGRWLVKTTCATKCGPSGAPCAPGEICLTKGPAGMLLRSCKPDPCLGEELDCTCAKPVLCPDQEDACARVAPDVIQCLQ